MVFEFTLLLVVFYAANLNYTSKAFPLILQNLQVCCNINQFVFFMLIHGRLYPKNEIDIVTVGNGDLWNPKCAYYGIQN